MPGNEAVRPASTIIIVVWWGTNECARSEAFSPRHIRTACFALDKTYLYPTSTDLAYCSGKVAHNCCLYDLTNDVGNRQHDEEYLLLGNVLLTFSKSIWLRACMKHRSCFSIYSSCNKK